MHGGSQNLRRFRIAIRDGATVEAAAEMAGMSIGEARLWIEDDAANPPGPECFKLLDASAPSARNPTARKGESQMPKTATQAAPIEGDDFDEKAHLVELADGTLRGDVRDSILAWFKAQPKPWGMMNESEQRNLASGIDRYSGTLVKEMANLIAANERPCIVANLVEYKEKDGLEAKLKLAGKAENVIELHKACGREVLIVTSGAEDFLGEGGEAEIDADQPHFPGLDAEGLDTEA